MLTGHGRNSYFFYFMNLTQLSTHDGLTKFEFQNLYKGKNRFFFTSGRNPLSFHFFPRHSFAPYIQVGMGSWGSEKSRGNRQGTKTETTFSGVKNSRRPSITVEFSATWALFEHNLASKQTTFSWP